ncbi:hypothetical protein PRIPAC_92314 [Pristionchus pacificus]|uniref:Uncharacterized protein n=1 Tax=Pristionchus pacificus TaxID=54126 RepID=A0A454XSX6_PRIPA|nr:hypothetical protein PRIPAC_92314 [Pristionchus pacificus]|eukprot:PDM76406.1 hypothetical protein PRIPAC_40010 [Pristionchus pacificus]
MGKTINYKSGLWQNFTLSPSRNALCKLCKVPTEVPRHKSNEGACEEIPSGPVRRSSEVETSVFSLAQEARKRLASPPTRLLYRSHLKSRLSAEHGEDQLMLRMTQIKSYRAVCAFKDSVCVANDVVPVGNEYHHNESEESGEESELED